MWRCTLNLFNGAVASSILFEVIDCQGKVKSQVRTKNIMTSLGLMQWARQSLGSSLAVGAGSREEVENISALVSYTRTQSGSYSYPDVNNIDEANGVMLSTSVLSVLFPAETQAQNYSECGIHSGNVTELQTYAAIRNTDGLPTTISVLAGEQLRATYAIQYSLPLVHTAIKELAGEMRTITVVPIRTGASVGARLPSSGGASSVRVHPAGTPIPTAGEYGIGGVSPPTPSVSQGFYTISANDTQLNLQGGIQMFSLGTIHNSSIGIHVHIDPPIQKNEDNKLQFWLNANLANGEYYN